MTSEITTQYPFDLARWVAIQLEKARGRSPEESVLIRLFEILYFASLRTDEGRYTSCTVNFVDIPVPTRDEPLPTPGNRWIAFPFASPLPLDIRTLTKLARAADPEVASLNVFADDAQELYIWGIVNELHWTIRQNTISGKEIPNDLVTCRWPFRYWPDRGPLAP